jgi:MAF protein
MVLEGSPEERATAAASAKALSLAQEATAGTVVGADTVVVLDGEVLGKPRDAEEALAMLRRLRGREHRVVTGVAVARPGGQDMKTAACSTSVWMRPYSDAEMEAFVASGEALDKAGAYAIQDLGFRPVRSLQGCPANVVGLPLCTLARLLEGEGVRAPSAAPSASTPCSLCLHLGLPVEESSQRQAKTGEGPEIDPTKREKNS